ncbi:MAG: response regulator [Candidatus Abyssubacteria bacterium]
MDAINLLLVDDEERFLTTHKKLLDRRGINTFTCTNGYEALKVLGDCRIDVVVLDIKMPGIDGFEVLRKIRQDHPDVEVILLTGHVSVDSEVEGLKLGVVGYLTKPVSIDVLQSKVEEAYDKRRARESRIRGTAETAEQRPISDNAGER